jgi:hypothetical protein
MSEVQKNTASTYEYATPNCETLAVQMMGAGLCWENSAIIYSRPPFHVSATDYFTKLVEVVPLKNVIIGR